jgi:hypothetical protein
LHRHRVLAPVRQRLPASAFGDVTSTGAFDREWRLREHQGMKNFLRVLVVAALLTLGLLMAWPRGATAEKPSGCQQWEVMLSQAVRIANDSRPLPEASKPYIEQAPSGWEPFAFGPTGQLVFRRCAK